MNVNGTFLSGNHGYNNELSFYLSEKVGVQFVHTTKCRPALCYVFGKVNYQSTTEQQNMSESCPIISMGATRVIGESTLYFVLHWNGIGCVTFLQTSEPSLSYSNIEYVRTYHDIEYATTDSNIISQQSSVVKDASYNPTKYHLDIDDIKFHAMPKEHNLQSMTKGQGGIKWHYSRSFHITSKVLYYVLPREQDSLSNPEVSLLCDNIGINVDVNSNIPPPDQQYVYMDLFTCREWERLVYRTL